MEFKKKYLSPGAILHVQRRKRLLVQISENCRRNPLHCMEAFDYRNSSSGRKHVAGGVLKEVPSLTDILVQDFLLNDINTKYI